jgi:endonuclease/exonuclease/phosphatase family metal-dependent hydrolase
MALVAAALGVWAWSAGAGGPANAVAPSPDPGSRPAPAGGWGALRVMTANIRLSEAGDGDNTWPRRRELVVKTLLARQPELIACQEVSPAQGAYLNKELAPLYANFPRAGVGTTDGVGGPDGRDGSGGGLRGQLLGAINQSLASLNTLYYRSDRFEAVDGESGLVLPDQPQADASENTYFTLAALKQTGDGRMVLAVDVHLRHNEAFAAKCAGRLREKLGAWVKRYPGAGVVVMGDMNHDRKSKVYAALVGADRPADGAPPLVDTFDYSKKPAKALWGNWHAFKGEPVGEWPSDLIFGGGALVTGADGGAEIVRDRGPGGQWPSDHFFVTATLTWRP